MKRIAWSLLIAIITCAQTGKATAATPGDTLDIVKRYMQYMRPPGFDPKNSPYYLRIKHTLTTTKGKTIELQVYNAWDAKAQKFYSRMESPEKKQCTAMAINGDKGWVNIGGRTTKCKKQAIAQVWASVNNTYLNPPVFNPELFRQELGEKRTIGKQKCTGVIFTNKEDSTQTVTYYFDDGTGLAVCSEAPETKVDFLEYKNFGGLLVCTKMHMTYLEGATSKNDIKERIDTVESACIDCILDPELFTHEAVKNAFKKKKKKE